MKKLGLIFLFLTVAISSSYSQTEGNTMSKKQFLYLLRLEKTMLDPAAWTPEKNKILQNHFSYLQKLLADGKLILAGRTLVEDDKTFGIMIYEEENLEAAKSIAENDPAVKGKVMTVEVYPYSVALIREGKEK